MALERLEDRGQDDEENREKPERPESAQAGRDGIVKRRRGRASDRECRDVFRQIRGVACHALFQKYAGSNETEDQQQKLAKSKPTSTKGPIASLFAEAHG